MPSKDPKAPTAVIIVRDFDGISVHTLLNIQRLFPNHFKNIVFISVGVIDIGQFKGHQEIDNLRRKVEENLQKLRRVRELPGLVRRVALWLGRRSDRRARRALRSGRERISSRHVFQR